MADDRVIGGAILIGSIAGVIIYFWLTFMSPWFLLTIQISAFVAVAMVLFIMAWIGYTLATTPPPTPLEDIDLGDVTEEEKEEEKEEKPKKEES